MKCRTPAPGTQAAFAQLMRAWADAGAYCPPQDGPRRMGFAALNPSSPFHEALPRMGFAALNPSYDCSQFTLCRASTSRTASTR